MWLWDMCHIYSYSYSYRHKVSFHILRLIRRLKTTHVLNWLIIIGWIKDIYISIIYHILSKSDFNVCTCSIYILYKMFNTQQHTGWHHCSVAVRHVRLKPLHISEAVTMKWVTRFVNNLGECSRLLRRPVRSISQQCFKRQRTVLFKKGKRVLKIPHIVTNHWMLWGENVS